MRDAQKQLEESKIKGAIEEQEKARQLLELAKAELEEILRQLREEEIDLEDVFMGITKGITN